MKVGLEKYYTFRKNKNNNFMFPNKKIMADQKTLLIPPKNLAFFNFTEAQKKIDKTALKLKNLEFYFFAPI